MPCGAIILTAGQSRRMGSNKLLLSFRGKPMIAHVADAVKAAGLPAIVVLGHAAEEVRDALTGYPVDFVKAADHAEGMGRSIAAGIAAVPKDWQAAIICLGDMPLISSDLLRMMAASAFPAAILVPSFHGRRGNPVLWGRDHFPALLELQGDEGARKLLPHRRAYVADIAWKDGSIFRDFDTPASLLNFENAPPPGN